MTDDYAMHAYSLDGETLTLTLTLTITITITITLTLNLNLTLTLIKMYESGLSPPSTTCRPRSHVRHRGPPRGQG